MFSNDLIKVSRYSEDALGGEPVERDDLVGEGGEDPGKAPAGEPVLLDVQDLLQIGKRHQKYF